MTEPVIAARKAWELKQALASLIEEGSPGEKEDLSEGRINSQYPIVGPGGWILDMTGKGYGGGMKILASYRPDGSVIDVVLMDNSETPGLGKKAEKSAYMSKFRNTGGSTPVPLTKDMVQEEIDTITGATITFTGIATVIKEGSDYVKTLGDN
jgi:electron transport complex protein RnfG